MVKVRRVNPPHRDQVTAERRRAVRGQRVNHQDPVTTSHPPSREPGLVGAMTREHVPSASGHIRRNRILGVAGATLAAAVVWAIEVPLVGIRLQTQFGNTAPQSVGIGLVVLSALAGSLAGWGLLAILEKRFARARAIWTGIAIAFLLVSFGAPISAGTTTTTKVALAMMHVAVAAVLIPTLRRG